MLSLDFVYSSRRENVSHSFHVLTLTRCAVQESSAGATPKVYSAFSRGVAGAHRGKGASHAASELFGLATRVFMFCDTHLHVHMHTHAHTGQAVQDDSLK